ncbi:3'-5' exonuclease [Acinetobacter tandoii]|uniref:Exodeoxyribonuclease X n=1 Tax=Acinetobacter tandoii DSM 14970 = CIP 107469 TaxID=1120927 RepID=R9ARZ4_9GAMM|nr:3'-5' exonuclease [Acinetobacter tandoii]EOR05002.1 exodeoxyribonuclease X [Acinetobacter tandoii DSM 14970 = CIP 107469]
MTALIFDTETHKLHGDIIEAAGIAIDFSIMENAKLSDDYRISPELLLHKSVTFSERYKPSEPISLGAMAVHHIVDEDLENCPSFNEFKFPVQINTEYLIGHNIDYDIAAVNRAGTVTKGIKTICTLAMSRYLWPTLDAHNLSAMALHISPNRGMTAHELRFAHSALSDCKTTFSVLTAIVEETGISSFEELYEFSEQSRYPTHIFYGKYRGWAIKDMEDKELHEVLNKTDDQYLRISLENELLARSNLDEQNQLPFD